MLRTCQVCDGSGFRPMAGVIGGFAMPHDLCGLCVGSGLLPELPLRGTHSQVVYYDGHYIYQDGVAGLFHLYVRSSPDGKIELHWAKDMSPPPPPPP